MILIRRLPCWVAMQAPLQLSPVPPPLKRHQTSLLTEGNICLVNNTRSGWITRIDPGVFARMNLKLTAAEGVWTAAGRVCLCVADCQKHDAPDQLGNVQCCNI